MDYPDYDNVLRSPKFSDFSPPEQSYYGVRQEALLNQIKKGGDFPLWQTGVKKVVIGEENIKLILTNGDQIITQYLIDASGGASNLSRHLIFASNDQPIPLVNDDPLVMWCFGEKVIADVEEAHTLYHPAGRTIGSASWILPWGNGEVDIIAAGFCRYSQLGKVPQRQIYQNFLAYCLSRGYVANLKTDGEKIVGFIRVQPIGPSSARLEKVLVVGDAAGVGSPVYGEVIPAILAYGKILAQIIGEEKTALDFYRLWRYQTPYFPYDLE